MVCLRGRRLVDHRGVGGRVVCVLDLNREIFGFISVVIK